MLAMAARWPERVAYRMVPSGFAVTWGELERRSRRCAQRMLQAGLRTGDGIAVYLENHPRYFELLWAAHRIGLYYTTISLHLKPAEMAYILQDCGARLLFCSAHTARDLDPVWLRGLGAEPVVLDGPLNGLPDYEAWLSEAPADAPLPAGLPEGTDFSYSSGTTGVPKGIKRPLERANAYFQQPGDARTHWKQFDIGSVYLSTAPFYHTAPVRWNMAVMRAGGTSVMMEKFDPLLALQTVEKYRVTHGQWVPTMFSRLLRLAPSERNRYDLSSMRYAIHAAAPCPIELKERMIEWWGPILYEYYSGTELVGRTSLDSHEWLAHRGSVGRPEFGAVHIVDGEGRPLPPRQQGVIYFEGGSKFEYHNDPVKTRSAYNEKGWGTYGDIGYLDEDGYLYLTDRLANTIVSGGVNIYPQEAENILSGHPAVRDVAVVGVPDADYGESVKAVVELIDPSQAGPALESELIAYCKARISAVKSPKSVDFVPSLPRTETGKLLKREVRDRYWSGASRIAH
ncbi:acyl-CoA synthetase [Achromobacter sp. DMS1]|uniref:AMP-binding protein n=1 Tax=Achromobacter sp. DMS1 TaxID=1688405 RepID=UPI00069E217E|nr:AMP-binding protein [Achromobacter sp. DMS1]KOF54230.1 acyl-CoA synthetase [Achromobacter sp. DMS1]